MVPLRDLLLKKLADCTEDLPASWRNVLGDTELNFESRAFNHNCGSEEMIIPSRKGDSIPGAPLHAHIFHAFDRLTQGDVRAVIVGQDPYPTPAWATGRAFSPGTRNLI